MRRGGEQERQARRCSAVVVRRKIAGSLEPGAWSGVLGFDFQAQDHY